MHSACLVLACWLSWSYTHIYTGQAGSDTICILFQAQILSATAAKPRLGHVPKVGKLPVIFFGTIEVTWSSSKDVCSWAQGLKNDLWSKNKSKNRQLFDLGVEQVLIDGVPCCINCCCYLSIACWTLQLPLGSPCLHNEKQPIICMLQSAAFSPCCVRRTEHEPNFTAQKTTDCNSNPSIMGWAVLAYATQAITPAPSFDCQRLKAVYQSRTNVTSEYSSILCLQVRDFLHPKGGRKAPQHWWCKPPAMPAQQAPAATPHRTLTPSKRKAAAVTASQAPTDKSAKAAKLESDAAAAGTPADGDATAGLDGAAAADQPAAGAAARSQQKRKLSTAKTKIAKHMPLTESQPQRQIPDLATRSTATEHATAMADPAAPATELEPVALPALAQPILPGTSRQNKAAAPRKVSGQGLGGVSAFSARALSDLMEDGPLLEALQGLLTAMQVPSATAPAIANRDTAAATHNLAGSKAEQADIESNAAAGQEPAGPAAALVDGAAAIPAAASHAQQGSMAGVLLVSSELPQASVMPVKAEGGSHADAAAAAAAAAAAGRAGGQLGRQESKRLRGKAAALAKALGLNTAGVAQHCFTASNVDMQVGQSEGEGLF